jgi:hypothetical protein
MSDCVRIYQAEDAEAEDDQVVLTHIQPLSNMLHPLLDWV